LLLTAATIFVVELLVMLLLPLLPPLDPAWVALADALTLLVLLFPVLFMFFLRPMQRQVRALVDARARLQGEIQERRAAEAALRESERQLHLLSAGLMTSQESERRQVSRQLHEDLGQVLAMARLRLDALVHGLPDGAQKLRGELEGSLGHLDQVISGVRRLSHDLNPAILDELGLSAALQRLFTTAGEHPGVSASLEVADLDDLLTRESQRVVFRILQEALANALEHSGATHLGLAVRRRDHRLTFEVADDGRGFDPRAIQGAEREPAGLGLATMRERARMLGGNLDIDSRPGQGTRVTLSI